MMKRILCLVLAAVMMASMGNFALADTGKVEISFKVGDSTLMINGNAVSVETPYIAGEGTTLVPLRVITEAFGATVEWKNETKEIYLSYPEVNIVLQIGNVNATVNNHTETLPEAPVLSANGVTMVPLRFISETFGATVGYDNDTKAITVVKQKADEGDTISSSTELPRIGDSYHNWSMMTPQGMMMTDRTTDGRITTFEDDEENVLEVAIFKLDEDDDFDKDFDEIKSMWSSYTLSKAEKSTDLSGNKQYSFTARSKDAYYILRAIYTKDKYYEISVSSVPGNKSIAALNSIVESFKAEFASDSTETAQTHDLSNVDATGFRPVELEELGITFKLPANLTELDTDSINKYAYILPEGLFNEGIFIVVYSKNEEAASNQIAAFDRETYIKYYNPNIAEVSELQPYTRSELGENAYYFWVRTNELQPGDIEMYNVYFELGDYVYQVSMIVNEGDNDRFVSFITSLKADVIDKAELGEIIYVPEYNIDDEAEKIEKSNWKISLPALWKEESSNDAVAVFSQRLTQSVLTLTRVNGEYSFQDLAEIADTLAKEVKRGAKMVGTMKKNVLGATTYYTYQICRVDEETGVAVYMTQYVTVMRGNVYIFTLVENEINTNAGTKSEAEEIIASFKLG